MIKKCMQYLWFAVKIYAVSKLSYTITLLGLAALVSLREMEDEENA